MPPLLQVSGNGEHPAPALSAGPATWRPGCRLRRQALSPPLLPARPDSTLQAKFINTQQGNWI